MCVCGRRRKREQDWALQANPNPSLQFCPVLTPGLKVISRSGLSLRKEGEGTVCIHAADAAAGQPNLLTPAQRPLENSPPPPSQSRGSD